MKIKRVSNKLRIRPVRRSLANVLDRFASFDPNFMADGRNEQDQNERETI